MPGNQRAMLLLEGAGQLSVHHPTRYRVDEQRHHHQSASARSAQTAGATKKTHTPLTASAAKSGTPNSTVRGVPGPIGPAPATTPGAAQQQHTTVMPSVISAPRQNSSRYSTKMSGRNQPNHSSGSITPPGNLRWVPHPRHHQAPAKRPQTRPQCMECPPTAISVPCIPSKPLCRSHHSCHRRGSRPSL